METNKKKMSARKACSPDLHRSGGNGASQTSALHLISRARRWEKEIEGQKSNETQTLLETAE